MYAKILKIIEMIYNNDEIDQKTKEKLVEYTNTQLKYKVYLFNDNDAIELNKIFKKLEYDYDKISAFFNIGYNVKNAISKKRNEIMKTEGKGKFIKPKISYITTLLDVLEKLNFDYFTYQSSTRFSGANNLILSRLIYRMQTNKEILNNEISIIELSKRIYDKYYNKKEINGSLHEIIKTLNLIDRGVSELSQTYQTIFLSDEIEMMFTCKFDTSSLFLTDIIRDFYPIFQNELFFLINQIANVTSEENFTTNEVVRQLKNIQELRKCENITLQALKDDFKIIESNSKKKIKTIFDETLTKIKENESINDISREKIINNINLIFSKYESKQEEFIDETLVSLFKNIEFYVNELVTNKLYKMEKIEEVINECLINCKDFFLEYDGKKFKEIIDFLLSNTSLDVNDLKILSNKCITIFKETDANKFKTIYASLNEFKNLINSKANMNEQLIDDNLLNDILTTAPDLVLNNENNLINMVNFLKGDLNLKHYGYKGIDFKLDKNFISYNFLSKIIDDNYKVLFECSMDKIINNLNMIENIANSCNINFKYLKISEDMIYTILKENIDILATERFSKLKTLFANSDLKAIIEHNPEVLMIDDNQLELLIEKSVLNCNESYDFFDLLSSELYYFKRSNFISKTEKEILNSNFKYVDLDLEKNTNFDIEDILTSTLIVNGKRASFIYDEYNKRKDELSIDEMLSNIENNDSPIDDLYNNVIVIIQKYEQLYSRVPNIAILNRITETITNKIDYLEFQISDYMEELDEKTDLLNTYKAEKKDGLMIKTNILNFYDQIQSDSLRSDIDNFIKHIESKSSLENTRNQREISLRISQLNDMIEDLNDKVSNLQHALLIASSNDEEKMHNTKIDLNSYVTIDQMSKSKTKSINIEEIINNKLNGKNIILIDDSIELTDIPNDRNFIDKIYKFLIDDNFSIRSQKFMKDNYINPDVIEKYVDQREGIYSRRENGTPVRIYFIPIKTKYFNSYYVIGINYKDSHHLDAGCSTDYVYNLRLKSAKRLEEAINKMNDIDDVLNFIDTTNKEFEQQISPIIEKYNRKKK